MASNETNEMTGSWPKVRIGDVAEVFDGPHATPTKTQNGPIFLGISSLNRGRLDLSNTEHLSEEEFVKWTRRVTPRAGDVVFSYETRLGEAAIIPAGLRCCLGRRMGLVRTKPSELDPHFFLYQYLSPKFQELLESRTIHGSTVDRIALKEFPDFEIDLPPLSVQREIAKAMLEIDTKIDLNHRINQTLEAMAQALFKSWFVDFDPVKAKIAAIQEGRDPLRAAMSAISGKPETELDALPPEQYEQLAATAALFPAEMEESELGEIPRGWQTLPVYDIATYVNGTAFKAFQPNDERRGLPIIKIAELKAGVTAQTKFSDVAMPEKYRLRTGDILFSWSGNPDTSIDTFIWAHGDAWLNQHIFRVDIHSPNERAFVIATLEYLRPVLAEIARNKQTTGLGHVTVGDMQRLLVVKPEEQALAAWDRMAAPIFAAAFRNEADSISLTQLRDTLLPKLLSGELPVENLSPDLEATV
jgi:type I restriction enzyme S subunit